MVTAWITIGLLLSSIEYVLWMIFNRKAAGLSFPHEMDESFFRFFTLTRLRLVAFLHTLLLIAVFIFFSSFLW